MFLPPPIQEVKDDLLTQKQVRLLVKREDLIHPTIKGNKWYKLKHNLEEAKKQGFKKLLTFGGAFSNHIYATASAGQIFGFETIGIIRGEEHLPLNPILSHAMACNMTIKYIDRTTYRNKTDTDYIDALKKEFGDFYLIPEGGTNDLAVEGTTEILQNINFPYQYVCCACGTGGTLAGLIRFVNESVKQTAHGQLDTHLEKIEVLGFSVLKGNFLEKEVAQLVIKKTQETAICNLKAQWSINHDYHCGGYAKTTIALLDFVRNFNEKYHIPIEPVYTGKLFYGIFDLIYKDYFSPQAVILAIHSGGVNEAN